MSLRSKLESARAELAAAAQAVVDEWSQDEDGWDEELGGGGACDEVSRAMSDVVCRLIPEADVTDGGQDGDDHAYIVVYDDAEAFAVDVPPGVYEEGGGYSWRKVDGATVAPEDVVIVPVDRGLAVVSSVARRIASGEPEVVIVPVGEDGDEDAVEAAGLDFWEAAEKAEAVFRKEGIRFGSEEDIAFAAVCGGEVVGGATIGHHEEEGETVWTFSVAVDGAWQQRGLGRRLVQTVVDEIRSSGAGGQFRVWVVNPNMARLLESMGFETEGRGWSQDSPHMYMQA